MRFSRPESKRFAGRWVGAGIGVMLWAAANAAISEENKGQPPTIFAAPIAPTLEAQQTKIAKGMSPIDVLMAREAIRDNWTNYSLLIDGDGVAMREAEWAKLSFTKDFKWVWYDATGHTTGEVGIANMARIPAEGVNQRPWKHLPIAIKFDEITPTTAKTRTIVVMFMVPKATVPGRPDGAAGLSTPAVPQAGQAVYHDTWRKENGIWMKSSTIVYSANCGFFPQMSTDTCVDPKVLRRPGFDKPEPAQPDAK
jgi:SnoaL-like domain